MPKCSVKKCKNNTLTRLKRDGVSYFRFPKNEIEREMWRQVIADERGEEYFKPNDSSIVCSCHFSESDMYYTKKGFRKIKKGVLPSIEIGISTQLSKNVVVATATTSGSQGNEPSTSGISDNLIELQIKSEESDAEENKQCEPQNAHVVEQNSNNRCTPVLTFYYKKTLRKYKQTIISKNKQIQNLKKKNKRLIQRNMSLKEIVSHLKKKRFVDESLSNDLNKKINESNNKVRDILTGKKKVSFAKYPPELRKFALTLHFHSPAAYKYLRDVFAQNLPHPNTLFRWYRDVDAQPGFTEEIF